MDWRTCQRKFLRFAKDPSKLATVNAKDSMNGMIKKRLVRHFGELFYQFRFGAWGFCRRYLFRDVFWRDDAERKRERKKPEKKFTGGKTNRHSKERRPCSCVAAENRLFITAFRQNALWYYARI